MQPFSNENVLTEHKENCLSINGTQSVKLEKETIKLENYFQLNLEGIESYEGSYTKQYQDHVPYSFAYKVVCIDDKFRKSIVVFKRENAAYEFIKAILKEHEYCKKVMKKHKNITMSENEEEQFQSSNSCWICKKLIDNDDQKVRDHCQPNKFDTKINVIPNRLEKYMAFFCIKT